MPPRRSGEEERDQLLSADYRRRCDPLCTLVQLKQLRHNTEPAPPAYGRYVALRAEVPEEDMEWYIEGPDGDLMEHFGFSPPRGSAGRSRRQRKEEEYMERVRRGVLRGGYVEEPRRSRVDFEEKMDVAAVGTHGGLRWESPSTSRPAFIVFKAADAAVWELKDIRPPMYDGNPLNLDRFLEKLHDWMMTVTEDMDPATAEKHVFKQF